MSSSTVESRVALATAVLLSADTLTVELADGRTIAVPSGVVSPSGKRNTGRAEILAIDRRWQRDSLARDR